MRPMFLSEVEQRNPGGAYAHLINKLRAAGHPVPQIMHLFAYKPDRTDFLSRFTQGVMRGPSPLPPGLRELIAAFTSRRNDCLFWIGSHAAVAASLLGDRSLVDAVLQDYRTAPISDREKALFAFVEKVNRESSSLQKEDIEDVKAEGWSEEALYDAITVCALFNFYNKWTDATGVSDMTPAAYAISGERLSTSGYIPPETSAGPDKDCPVGADDALARLMDGNARFLRGEPRYMRTPVEVLADLAKGQRPIATILGCSDSRVPPELIFDAGFGDLFIIRVAGHVVSPEVAGSLQYAGTHLKTRLFMVLGHEGCGAVQAALAAKFLGAQERSRIQLLLQNLLPGLDGIDPHLPPPQQLAHAVDANVRWTMRQILDSPEGRARMAEGCMKVVGAICDISTGRVRLLT